jgi:hypothetical protein
MNIPDLTRAVQAAVIAQAPRLHLDPHHTTVRYILNWGGFIAASFHVTDGATKLHCKLIASDDRESRLRRWMSVADLLESRYRAPRVLDWIEIPGTRYRGPVFEHIDGVFFNIDQHPTVPPCVFELLDRLHHDRELADRIVHPASPRTLRECFHERFFEQYTDNLRTVSINPPPFVSADTLKWMHDESQRLLELPTHHVAFDGLATALCHGDVWANNLLIQPDGEFRLIDWDPLDLGDPAIDYSNFCCWPPLEWRHLPAARDRAFVERMEIYLRAVLLDWTIDVLPDWIECDVAPDHAEEFRRGNQRLHEIFLAEYRHRYSLSLAGRRLG